MKPSCSSATLRSVRRPRTPIRSRPSPASLPSSPAWCSWSSAIANAKPLLLRQRAADHQALDVAGALVDLADADVAVDALDREVGEVAVAAMDLQRVGA